MNMTAYLDVGPALLDLGVCAELLPETARRTLPLPGGGAPAWSFGGERKLVLQTHCLRANRGDAERYAWERLRALATAGPATLGVEDEFGRRSTWRDCVCASAVARVHGERLAVIEYRFAAPETTATPAWQGPPDPPATYPQTATLQDYSAGVPLGDHATGLRMHLSRRSPLRPIPRTRGARVDLPYAGAALRMSVTGWLHRPAESLPGALAQMVRSISTDRVALQANGNTYSGLRLEHCTPRRRGLSDLQFYLTFLQEISP
jgi:hypothetical protein